MNDPPSVLSLSPDNLAENAPPGTTVGALAAEDPDLDDTFTYALVAGVGDDDNALFSIAGNELRANNSLDYESTQFLTVRVAVTDQNDAGLERVFVITVQDVNEAPTLAFQNSISSLSEDRDTSVRIKVAEIDVTDDALGTNTLTLSGTDAAMFEIDGLELFIQAGVTLDFETKPVLNVAVEVDDDEVGTSPDDTASMAIAITDVNEPPVANIGGPYSIEVGADLVLDASASIDPEGNIATYEWDLDGDGQFGDSFNFERPVVGAQSSLTLFPSSVDAATGAVTINGVDTQCPTIPFTWDWGDGTPTEDAWFPAAHVYADTTQNYVVTVTAHYSGGETDMTEGLVRFVSPIIAPVTLPETVEVVIPDHETTLSHHRMPTYAPPDSLTYFDDAAFGITPRSTLEYVLTAGASVQAQLVGDNTYMANDTFHQVLLRDADLSGASMYSLWYTDPIGIGAGTGALQGAIPYSSLLHEMGHNVTLNFPEEYYFGGKIDGLANAIYSETMAQIFQHVTAYELVNRADQFGLPSDLAVEIGQSATSTMWVVRNAYESYLGSGCDFCSWNDPATPQDETFGTFMTLAYKFFAHAEMAGIGYAFPAARMSEVLALFNAEMEEQYDRHNDSADADAFRSTLMVSALSHAFSMDLRAEFRDLNFPIDDVIYEQLLDAVDAVVVSDPTSSRILYRWSDAGVYPVAVRVTDAEGAWDVATTTVTVIDSAPTITQCTPSPGSLVTTTPVDIDVSFSEAVQGVDATDMVLSGTAATHAVVGQPIDLGSNTWRFAITGLQSGMLEVSLAPDTDDIEDLAGNDLAHTQWSYSVTLQVDFGDAPDTAFGTSSGNYNTLASNDGPSHTIVTGLHMGASVDADDGTLQNATADADDVDQIPDDEDGINNPATDLILTVGTQPTVNVIVTNTTGSEATLYGWIDYDADGVFSNVTERAQIAVPDGITGAVVTLVFPTVPAGNTGTTYARFRLSTDGAAADPTGAAADGEVEDYEVLVDTPTYDDIVGRASSSGDWFVAKSDGTSFANEHWGKWSTAVTWSNVLVGDFTGDGKDDVVGRADSTGDWFVAKATDSGFVTEHWGKWTKAVTWDNIMVGDFNGDGKDDLVGRAASSGDWFVGRSTGTGFAMEHWGKWTTAVNWNHIQVGDFNGDGYDDLVGRAPSSGDWFVAKSSSTNFATEHWGKWTTAVTWSSVLVGDFTGDGKDDVVGRADSSGDWFTSRSTGSSFAFEHWGKWTTAVNWDNIMVGDFNGDGYDDLIGRAPSSGDWFVAKSSSTNFVMEHWGKWTTAVNWSPILTGDFTGDGKDDLAARADSSGDWFVSRSTGTSLVFEHWGRWTTAVPWVDVQVGDFDGAGGSSSGSVAGPAHAAAALDQFWSDFGDDDEEEEPLVVDAVDLWLMER